MKSTLKNIQIIINPSEITAGTRGSSLGPEALKVAARNNGSSFFGEFPIVEIKNENHLLDAQSKFPFAKRIDGLVKVQQAVCDQVKSTFENKCFPIVLAGDHGSATGTIDGIKAAFPQNRIGVVWIDAHADIHSPYTTPSGNMHGMPLSAALHDDNIECQVNEVDELTKQYWNNLKAIGGNVPKILPQDLIFVGVRDTEEQENAILKRHSIRNVMVDELRKIGVDNVLKIINEKLMDCDCIYVSFDVDSMDPHLTSYGTGTPVDKGLSFDEAKDLILGLMNNEKLCCFEMVEVNPTLDDQKNRMAELAFDILENAVQTIIKK